MDRRPGRIEFMSTQRPRGHWQRTSCTHRAGANGLWSPAQITRYSRAFASGESAQPDFPTRPDSFDVGLGTASSLHKDHRFHGRIPPNVCPSGPPGGTVQSWTGTSVAARSSLSPISFLSGSATSHPTSPHAPAGETRWAERYDGEGNLYIKHAA
jgi:hypothetical protein